MRVGILLDHAGMRTHGSDLILSSTMPRGASKAGISVASVDNDLFLFDATVAAKSCCCGAF